MKISDMQEKIQNDFFPFLDSNSWSGSNKFVLLRREYFSSAVNVLTNTSKI